MSGSAGQAPIPPTPSKFSKLLPKVANRDRSRSVSSTPSGVPSGAESAPEPTQPNLKRRGASAGGGRLEPPPIILERPSSTPNASSASSGPGSAISPITGGGGDNSSITSSTSASHTISSKLSGWFSHLSSPDLPSLHLNALLSSPSLASNPLSGNMSPKARAQGILTAARHSRTMRYLLDTDVMSGTGEAVWMLGVEYLPASSSDTTPSPVSPTESGTSEQGELPAQGGWNGYPPAFYEDFTHLTWLTYRSHFPPIKDSLSLSSLLFDPSSPTTTQATDTSSLPNPQDGTVNQAPGGTISSSPSKRFWSSMTDRERSWTTDSGWGCMLRTGQALLFQALVNVHLGRQWYLHSQPPSSHPSFKASSNDTVTYQTLLTWFLDSPAPQCPYSVHRFALAGKELDKDVGQWFGPSTAAGTIKRLVTAYPASKLGVSIATDQVLYQSDVIDASYSPGTTRPQPVAPPLATHQKSSATTSTQSSYSRKRGKQINMDKQREEVREQEKAEKRWGDRAVLCLVNSRLGIHEVHPSYYECLKALFRFPTTVGISGGRPSSSYYFVGYQGDHLIYLDPHYARPAVPFPYPNPPHTTVPPAVPEDSSTAGVPRRGSAGSGYESSTTSTKMLGKKGWRGSGSTTGSLESDRDTSGYSTSTTKEKKKAFGVMRRSPTPGSGGQFSPTSSVSSTKSALGSTNSHQHSPPGNQLHGTTVNATPETGLREIDIHSYRCDKVRKMPPTNMDPSMLLGFLIRNREEWDTFRRMVSELPKPIFGIVDEIPRYRWDLEDGEEEIDEGVRSLSEPDLEDEDELGSGGDEERVLDGLDIDVAGGGTSTPRSRDASQHRHMTTEYATSSHAPLHAPSDSLSSAATTGTSGSKPSQSPSEEELEEPLTPGPASPPRGHAQMSAGMDKSPSRFPIREDSDSEREGGAAMKRGATYKARKEENSRTPERDVHDYDDDDDWVDASASPSCSSASTHAAAPTPRSIERQRRSQSPSPSPSRARAAVATANASSAAAFPASSSADVLQSSHSSRSSNLSSKPPRTRSMIKTQPAHDQHQASTYHGHSFPSHSQNSSTSSLGKGGHDADVEGGDTTDDWVTPSPPRSFASARYSSRNNDHRSPSSHSQDQPNSNHQRNSTHPPPPLTTRTSSSSSNSKSLGLPPKSSSEAELIGQNTPPETRTPTQAQYPFPLSTPAGQRERERKQSGLRLNASNTGSNLRARDGGRTKSGGVKAKLVD